MRRDALTPRAGHAGLRAGDAVRGVLIAVISAVAGFWILAPAEGSGRAPVSGGSIAMLAIAIALQMAVLGGNWLARRYERTHGMDGQLAPHARHVLQLLADGVTVLLFALAVFGGVVGAANAI